MIRANYKFARTTLVSFAATCGLVLFLQSSAAIAMLKMQESDREVPEFELQDTNARIWTRDDLLGKPYIVNFWATWCPPCVEELPSLNSLWGKLENEGVGMLAINADESLEVITEFEKRINIEFPVLLGGSNSFGAWQARALPTTFVVNSHGQIVYTAVGDREWDDEEFLTLMLELR